MSLKRYLIDKKFAILFYFLLMCFISLVIFLDGTVKVDFGNILYINFVSLVLFAVYLLGEYFYRKKFYMYLEDIIMIGQEDIINQLPEPKTYEQSLYTDLLKNIYEDQSNKIEMLYEEKRQNQEFVTSWVHEIKTPIAVSRLIIENGGGKSVDEILNSFEEELDKIDSYVEQSLYYSRIDSFSKDYLIGDVELGKVIKGAVKKQAKTFINKRIRIEMEETDLSVTTDKKWLCFIIDQILANSLKYTNEGGKIKIISEKDEKEKRLIIEDSGIGIKTEDIGRVFEKGFTGCNGRDGYKSTGMGLYLAKSLAIKLGHDISIESVHGEFTRVIIHFPKLTDYFKVAK